MLEVSVSQEENVIKTDVAEESKEAWAQAGTARALINNMVEGVSNWF